MPWRSIKNKTYCITIMSPRNRERLNFEKSEYFNERLKIRYWIEEKNGELKEAHGLRTADSTGLAAMRLQAYFSAFTVNIKRIVKLMEYSEPLRPTPLSYHNQQEKFYHLYLFCCV